MFQLLHFADLHLERSFASTCLPTSVGSLRRADLRATLGCILTLARERQVDAVTVAGDLYEQDYALPDTADFLVQQFEKLAPIHVFIAPGQHDPYTHDSLYAITRWPENVTVFDQSRLTAKELAPGIVLWGGACPPARGRATLGRFQTNQDGINLLLLHAVDAEQTAHDGRGMFAANPEAVQIAGFDFALLGGQHNGRLWPEGAPNCVYPGSPEPLVADEGDGDHQVVVLTIQDDACTPDLIPIGRWHYHALTVDLTGCDATGEVAAQVTQSLQALRGDDERTICTVTLTGVPEFHLDLTELTERVDSKAHLRYRILLSPPYDLAQVAQEQTVRGLLVRRFQEQLALTHNSQDRQLVVDALDYALQALAGKQVQPYEVE